MKVERIQALPLTKEQTLEYAKRVVGQKLGKTAEKVGYLGGGSFGRAASVKCKDGQKLVVKFLRAKGMMQKEAHDLTLLAKYSTVKVPGVLFTRLGDSEIPVDCYGMEQIEGKSSLFALGMLFLGKKRRKQFADQVTAARQVRRHDECRLRRLARPLPPLRRGGFENSRRISCGRKIERKSHKCHARGLGKV